MSADRRGLITAIRENPDDDTPRLICADWFEERGNEAGVMRAQFIRTQIARARLAPDDPRKGELWGNRDFPAAAAKALFASEQLRSLVELNLNATPLGPVGVEALATADGWDRLRTLTLTVAGVRADDLVRLFGSPNLRQLVTLRLGFVVEAPSALTPRVAAALTRLPHLASLHLTAERVPDEVRSVLAASESLAWQSVSSADDPDGYRIDPNNAPPLDEELEEVDQ